jgi:hypothetical protein
MKCLSITSSNKKINTSDEIYSIEFIPIKTTTSIG